MGDPFLLFALLDLHAPGNHNHPTWTDGKALRIFLVVQPHHRSGRKGNILVDDGTKESTAGAHLNPIEEHALLHPRLFIDPDLGGRVSIGSPVLPPG